MTTIFSLSMIYIMAWWVVLFILLPVGIEDAAEQEDARHAPGAPKRTYLQYKLLAATLIAAVVTAGVYFALEAKIIPLRGAF